MTAETDIGPLLREAVATYNAMSPVEQALLRADQRRSFVRGQIGRDPGPDVLAEEVRRLRAENAALRQECAAVLEPFDTMAQALHDWPGDEMQAVFTRRVDSVRNRETGITTHEFARLGLDHFQAVETLRARLLKEREE